MTEKEIELVNKLFKKKENHIVDGSFGQIKLYYNFKITGIKPMISIGEWKNYLTCNITVTKVEGPNARLFELLPKINLRLKEFNIYIETLMRRFGNDVENSLKIFDVDRVIVERLEFAEDMIVVDSLPKIENLTESKVKRNVIRNVIRDITNIVKIGEEDEYNLPYDINGEDEYYFDGLPPFNILLETVKSDKIRGNKPYQIDADYVIGQNEINVLLIYKENELSKSLYNMIGDLNDYISHELQHLKQEDEGTIDDNNEFKGTNKDYFLQRDEIEAQYRGFKNKSKITNQPITKVIDDWFKENSERFDLTDEDVEEIKTEILKYGNS
jgi:hypothetical protein